MSGETPTNDYYLWKKEFTANAPWLRQHINGEFYKFEQQQISKASAWKTSFHKQKEKQQLSEVFLFVVPVQLHTSWLSGIAERFPNHVAFGLNALQNSPHVLTLALFPQQNAPKHYQFIRLTKSRKDYVFSKFYNSAEWVAVVDEWEIEASESLYVDIPTDNKYLPGILLGSLGGEKNLALSFQSPLVGAPYVRGSVGGIALSSLSGSSFFARELVRTVQLLAPPEYRSLLPPKKAIAGSNLQNTPGISFSFAERPHTSNKVVGVYGETFSSVATELGKREQYSGEYSVFSALKPQIGSRDEIVQEFLQGFSKAEITIPENIDDLQQDLDLTRLKREASEELWAQIVKSRQHNPSPGTEWENSTIDRISKLKADLDMMLASRFPNDTVREAVISHSLTPISENVNRLSQSFARANNSDELMEADWKQARNLTVDNFGAALSNPQFRVSPTLFAEKKSTPRYTVLQAALIANKGSVLEQLWDAVKSSGYYKNIHDVQAMIDWMHKQGHVFLMQNKYYWV